MFSDKADKLFEPLHTQQTQQQNEILHQDMRNFMQSAVNEATAANDQLQPVAMEEAIKSIESLHAQMDIVVHELQPHAEKLRPLLQDLPFQEDVHNQMQSQDQYWHPDLQLPTPMEDHTRDPIQHQTQAQAQVQQSNQVQLKIQNRDVHREQPTLQSYLELELQKIRAGSDEIQSQVCEPQPQLLPEKQNPCRDARMNLNTQYQGPQILDLQTSMEIIPSLQPEFGLFNRPFHFQSLNSGNNQTEEVKVDEIQPNTPINQPKKQKARRRNSQPTDLNQPKRRRIAKKSTNKNSSQFEDGSENHNAPPRFGSATDVKLFDAMRVGTVDGKVKCPQCDNLFANPEAMDRHFRMVHSNTNTKTYICQECRQPCRSITNLRQHWNNAHTGELDFVCDGCGARFATKRSRSLHQSKQHPDKYKPRPRRKKTAFRECKMCDYTSDQSSNVIRHFFTKHTDEVALECLHGCGRTFKSIANAKVHFYKCKEMPMIDE